MTASPSPQQVGKVSRALLDRVVLSRLGHADDDVWVGPRHGVDVGIVGLAGGQAMAVTTDPVFVVPAYGWERAAWFAVHILASDAATSALAPRFLSIDLNLPRSLDDDGLAALWSAMSDTCADLGLAVVAGHTGRYDGCDWPMVGGATCIATGPDDAWVVPTMARGGDRLVVTKGAAIEATALLAATFGERVRDGVGEDVRAAADTLFEQMTVVADAAVAVGYGLRDAGVTSLHDATEGGVLGGLAEVAGAAGLSLRVDADAVPVAPEVTAVCDLAGIDPLQAISEGTLVATVRPEHVDDLLTAYHEAGITAVQVGTLCGPDEVSELTRDGRTGPYPHVGADPFWEAFGRWAAETT